MGIPSSTLRWVLVGVTLGAFKVIVDKTLSLRNAFARIRDYPGRTVSWINPFGAVALMLGTRFPRPGMAGCQAGKFFLYKKFGATSFGSILISTAQQYLWTADPETIKLVTSDRHTFRKDVFVQEVIDIYGRSLISSEGAEWKRHRLVAMSAFNEANVALVWSEALRVTSEWFQQLDASGPDINVDMLPSMTEATFLVISAAGFGIQMPWKADSTDELPPAAKLTFRDALLGSVHNILFRILIPEWFYQFSSFIRVPYLSSRAMFTRLAFDNLRSHMLDLVASARVDVLSGIHSGGQGAALLRTLVEANLNQEGDSKRLTEGEVLSNIFLFLLAGHETSSHTLCFAFVLLALYPSAQQKMYEEITHILPEEVPVSQLMGDHKRYMDKLEYAAAVIRETLRLFPVANRLFKQVHADTVLPSTRFSPGSKECPSVETGKFSVSVPAGSIVVMDIWALHMNPLCWGEDVEEFRPERFIDTESYEWPRDAFLPFSGGARSCIGQRFAFAQMIGILASVVRRYRIQIPDDLAKKSFEVQKEALLKWKTSIMLVPLNAHVKLCRRG